MPSFMTEDLEILRAIQRSFEKEGEITQWIMALTALPKDLGSNTIWQIPAPGDPVHSFGNPNHQAHILCTDKHMFRQDTHTYKSFIKKIKFNHQFLFYQFYRHQY